MWEVREDFDFIAYLNSHRLRWIAMAFALFIAQLRGIRDF